MQIIYGDRVERLWADFRDAQGDSIVPEGDVTLSILHQDGSTVLSETPATSAGEGKYFYPLNPSGFAPGYYGVFWRLNQSGVDITQDIPSVFKVEARGESIIKGVMAEHVRSMLYMHLDSSGYQNKFGRDREINDYLEISMSWWNSYPPTFTGFLFTTLPSQYYSIIEEGALIKALEALGIFEAGKHFIYNDNGISIQRDRSAKYQAMWNTLLTNYANNLKALRTKLAFDSISMRGIFSSTTGFPRSLSRALRGVSKAI